MKHVREELVELDLLTALFPRDLVFMYPLIYADEQFRLEEDG
jgi:hypothetical protein